MEDTTARSQDEIETTLGLDLQTANRRRRRRWLIAGAAALLVLILIGLWFLRNGEEGNRFETAPVSRGELTVTVTATGTLEPVNQVDVGSELSGTIESVAVDFNDHVKKGQVLARLDTEQLKARVVQARASLQAAKAKLLEAQATVVETAAKLRRQSSLLEKKLTSREELDTARAAHSRAQASVESAEAQVKLADAALEADLTNLNKAVIVSPIDGIVLSRLVEPGQTVAASFQTPVLFKLAEDLRQMELRVDVDEADVGQVQPGQQATFTVDAYPDRTFSAQITTVHYAPKVTQDVVTYESRLRVDNSELLLRPGMTATADIIVQHLQNALLIPNAALRFTPPPSLKAAGQKKSFVRSLLPGPPARTPKKKQEEAKAPRNEHTIWVLKGTTPTAVTIKTGATDGRHTVVLGGDLQAGMKVITATLEQDKTTP